MKLRQFFVVFCLLAIAACSDDDPNANRLTVKVIDGYGQGIENATVVIGNQSGGLMSYVTTNEIGEAYFSSLPSNATVTAAFSCYASSYKTTYYYLETIYDVNISAVTLMLGTCGQNTQREVDIHVTYEVEGIAFSDVTLGPITYSGTNVTMDVYGFQDDGNISVFATGYDNEDNIKGYGFALDQPVVDGSVIDIVIDRTDLVQHTHSLVNVPLNTVSYSAFASLLRKHSATNLPYNFVGDTAPVPATITTYSFDSFSDSNEFGASLTLDQDNDGNSDGRVGFARYVQDASDQVYDFSLVPALPGDLTYNQGTTSRPIISWTNNDTLSTAQKLFISYRSQEPERASFSCSLTAPATVTSLIFPELPDTLAAFRPSAYNALSLRTMKFDKSITYNDFLDPMFNYIGLFYEVSGLSSYAYSFISLQP